MTSYQIMQATLQLRNTQEAQKGMLQILQIGMQSQDILTAAFIQTEAF